MFTIIIILLALLAMALTAMNMLATSWMYNQQNIWILIIVLLPFVLWDRYRLKKPKKRNKEPFGLPT